MADYGIGVDFAKNDGITFLIWRGKHDIHGTLKAKAADGFTMVGTSVQIAKQLVHCVVVHEQRLEEDVNTEVKVVGLSEQVEEIRERKRKRNRRKR